SASRWTEEQLRTTHTRPRARTSGVLTEREHEPRCRCFVFSLGRRRSRPAVRTPLGVGRSTHGAAAASRGERGEGRVLVAPARSAQSAEVSGGVTWHPRSAGLPQSARRPTSEWRRRRRRRRRRCSATPPQRKRPESPPRRRQGERALGVPRGRSCRREHEEYDSPL
ncbi:unnamed protein product, partial [Ixodes pacificus]